MQGYLKFSCGIALVGLLATACQKEAMLTPEEGSTQTASTSGKGGPVGGHTKPGPGHTHRPINNGSGSGFKKPNKNHNTNYNVEVHPRKLYTTVLEKRPQ